MAYEIGFVDNTGSEGFAHRQMLLKIKTFAEANGWTTLRYIAPTDVGPTVGTRELIMKGVGLSGTEEIFIGFRSYENVSSDYYNLSVACFTGYVEGNTWATQPGYFESGIPAHNQRIDYWLTVNAQRVLFGLKVGTPVYEHGYVGKVFPYAPPSQWPYPILAGGMLVGAPGTRFSDTSHTMPYRGNAANMKIRNPMGIYETPRNPIYEGSNLRDTNGVYPLLPLPLFTSASGNLGELDGVFWVSGFNNAVENTIVIEGVTYVILQDVARTGFNDYVALRMD